MTLDCGTISCAQHSLLLLSGSVAMLLRSENMRRHLNDVSHDSQHISFPLLIGSITTLLLRRTCEDTQMWCNIIARHLESSVAVVDWFDCDAASCGNEAATLDCGALSVAEHSGHAVLFLIRLIEMLHRK